MDFDHAGEDEIVMPNSQGWVIHPRIEVVQAHSGRMGGKISPSVVIWHDTDMRPNSGPALVRYWHVNPGAGNCAHFVIYEDGKIIQCVPVNRNANHAGGPGFLRINNYHPNSVSIGIELCNPGKLRVRDYKYYCQDGGGEYPAKGVDTVTAWAPYTPAQLESAAWLASSVLPYCVTLGSKSETVVVGSGTTAKRYPRYGLGHMHVNPTNKTDPGPLLDLARLHSMTWERKHGALDQP